MLKFYFLILMLALQSVYSQNYTHSGDSSFHEKNHGINSINFNSTILREEYLNRFPQRDIGIIYSYQNGVVEQDGKFHIRGGREDQTNFLLAGISIRNPLTGEINLNIPMDALKSISFFAGGFPAEYGNSVSGIIDNRLRQGTSKFQASINYFSDNITFKSKDNFFSGDKRLGTYWYGYNEINGSISGPIIDDRITYFINANYNYKKDSHPQEWPGINLGNIIDESQVESIDMFYPAGPVKGNAEDIFSLIGNVNLDLNPVNILLTGMVGDNEKQLNSTPVLSLLNPRYGLEKTGSRLFSLNLSHEINNKIMYEVNAGYFSQSTKIYDPYLQDDFWNYGDSAANAAAGWILSNDSYSGGYIMPAYKNIWDYSFRKYGSLQNYYSKSEFHSYQLNGKFSYRINENNLIQAGGDYQNYIIRNYEIMSPVLLASSLAILQSENPSGNINDLKSSLLMTNGINNFGYDILGNEEDDDFLTGARMPVFAGFFIKDILNYKLITVDAGLRFDYIDIDNLVLKNMARPEESLAQFGTIGDSSFSETPSFTSLSPRINITFDNKNNISFYTQYGSYIQQSKLADAYNGIYKQRYAIARGFLGSAPEVTSDVRPVRSTQYEAGIRYKFSRHFSAELAAYYKTLKDLSQPRVIQTVNSIYDSYSTIINAGDAVIKGMEVNFKADNYNGFYADLNIAIQDAKGTTSNSFDYEIYLLMIGGEFQKSTNPLDYEIPFKSNLSISYKFKEGASVLRNTFISLFTQYHSGHPFTKGVFFRPTILESSINGLNTPSFFQADLKIGKEINIYNNFKLDLFLWVVNLFNTKNVINVFNRTGSDKEDGNPGLEPMEEIYGEKYRELYNAININYISSIRQTSDIYFYGPPRQIMIGTKLRF